MQKIIYHAFILIGIVLLSNTVATAQRVSLIANIKALGINKVSGEGTNAVYEVETSFSGNLRLFTKNHFAFRMGVGVNKLQYTFNDNLNTNYEAVRQSMTAYLGLEKHFVAGFLTPYIGVYVPLTFNANNDISGIAEDLINTSGDELKTGLSLLGGLNIKLLKILRLGVEANIGFDNFKTEVFEPLIDEPSSVKFNNLDVGLEATLGLAF